jgi:hypothetical protein
MRGRLPGMKYRRVRVVFSLLCALVFVLLIGFWIDSYFSQLYVSRRMEGCLLGVQTSHGEVGIAATSLQLDQSPEQTWKFGRVPLMRGVVDRFNEEPAFEIFGFHFESMPGFASIFYMPFWALVMPAAVAGVLPWASWRIGCRSAFSAACLLMVVLVVALWVRSYDWFDITERTSALNICSMQGKLFVGDAFMVLGHDSANLTVPLPPAHFGICTLSSNSFELVSLRDGVAVPYWLVVAVMAPIGVVPWLRPRFSLRTMLVATAVVAVVLCVAIYALKR